MPDYPVMLQLEERRCVIVGAGAVGRRKLQSLLPSGARIVLVAPDAAAPDLPDGITIIAREFRDSDLDHAALAFAATDHPRINQQVAAAARARRIPVNIADDPRGSDFTLPAVLRRDALTVAVGTDGRSPAAAALIRDRLEQELGSGWSDFIKIAAKLRRLQLTSEARSLYNQQVLQNLLGQGLIQLLETGDRAGIEALFAAEFAGAVTLADIDISLPKGAS